MHSFCREISWSNVCRYSVDCSYLWCVCGTESVEGAVPVAAEAVHVKPAEVDLLNGGTWNQPEHILQQSRRSRADLHCH